jgi:hypothetical protein
VQHSGKGVREFIYADSENSYASTDLSLLASHLITNPRDLAVLYGTASRNEQYAGVVNSDGTMAVFHSARAEQLAGWTLWSVDDADIDAVCAINNALYVSVLRGTTYSLEKFAADDSLTLDSSSTYTAGSPTATWTVAARFNNKEVFVFGDGEYLGPYTVNGSSALILDTQVSEIVIGYDYTVEIKTLPANVMMPNGSMIGLPKRINRVFLGLDSTLGVSVQGNRLILRGVTDDFSLGLTPFTGIQDFYLLGYAKEAQITITQAEPLPMRVLGMNMEVAF